MINKKFKKSVLPFALAGTMMLAGCGNKEVAEKEVVVEPTTEVIETEEIQEDIANVDYYALAADTYNNYTTFYAQLGMAYKDENANQGINITRIENVIKVINGEVSDLTESDISNAKEDIGYILLSQDLVSNLDNVIAEELGYVTIEGNFNMCDVPSLKEYAQNEETIKFVDEYENLRNKVQNDLNTTNKVSDGTKKELTDAVVQMEKDYLQDTNNMNTDATAEGNKLLENLAKESLTELTILATNKTRIETEEFPGGLQLDVETDEERDIRSKKLIHGIEILTDEEKQIYGDMAMRIVVTKYEEGACEHEQNLANHAKDNADVYSEMDILKQYKEYLQNYVPVEGYEYTLSV